MNDNENKRLSSFLAIDVETPNLRHDRICSIGLVYYNPVIKLEPQCFSYLVNPETEFHPNNIEKHGIQSENILNQLNFRELWVSEIEQFFLQSVIVVHQASFDLNVLRKTLSAYNLKLPEISYIDTKDMAKINYPHLTDYGLSTVSSHLGYNLQNHHEAGEDAFASFYIMVETLKKYGPADLYIKKYQHQTNGVSKPSNYVPKPDLRISFKEILEEIVEDRKVEFDEAVKLSEWLGQNKSELPEKLYSELNSKLKEVMMDGVIDSKEESELLTLLNQYLNPASSNELVVFTDKKFVLTGDFQHGDKEEIQAMIESKGGTVVTGVSKLVNYVVMGDLGSDKYSNGTYGTKVKKAMEFQEQGIPIEIIKEDLLYP